MLPPHPSVGPGARLRNRYDSGICEVIRFAELYQLTIQSCNVLFRYPVENFGGWVSFFNRSDAAVRMPLSIIARLTLCPLYHRCLARLSTTVFNFEEVLCVQVRPCYRTNISSRNSGCVRSMVVRNSLLKRKNNPINLKFLTTLTWCIRQFVAKLWRL
jgi:hypothetical protein